jgi:hypothetical protein
LYVATPVMGLLVMFSAEKKAKAVSPGTTLISFCRGTNFHARESESVPEKEMTSCLAPNTGFIALAFSIVVTIVVLKRQVRPTDTYTHK